MCESLLMLLAFFILKQFRAPCLGNGNGHNGLDVPASFTKTVFYKHTHRPTSMRQVLN